MDRNKGIHNNLSVFFSVILAAPWFVEIQKVCFYDFVTELCDLHPYDEGRQLRRFFQDYEY